MKVTKYPQSCLLIEKEGQSIVIDPGSDFLDKYSVDELNDVRAVLYTHQHADHFDETIAQALQGRGVQIFCNESTAKLLSGTYTIIRDGDSFETCGFSVTARELPHCLLPNGAEGPQNTGYVIDGVLFHPGDGKDIDNLKVKSLALPITGPDISMKNAFDFAKKVEAQIVIPIHYDKIGANPHVYKIFATRNDMPFEMIVLDNGESTEL
jgi:L-ascorbate metabolism protein UlaG (beta-lactamase superfamily)